MYLGLSGADMGQVASIFGWQSTMSQSREISKRILCKHFVREYKATWIARFTVCFEYLCMIFIAGYYCIHKSTGQKNVKTSNNNHQTGSNQPRHSGQQTAQHPSPGHLPLVSHAGAIFRTFPIAMQGDELNISTGYLALFMDRNYC